MKKYIVTDLTRFSNLTNVCTAVIDSDTGQCFRPMPYLKSKRVQELNIHPGAILTGNIMINKNTSNPHIEDASYQDLTYVGPATGEQFKEILEETMHASVSDGFGIEFREGQKHIPHGNKANCSIITIKVSNHALKIHEDEYKPGRIKASFTDGSGQEFRYLSITDRGFFDYAKAHQNDGKLQEVQNFINSQEEVYLRIGVGRQFVVGDRDGYWLQVNGIYTFPNFYKEIREY